MLEKKEKLKATKGNAVIAVLNKIPESEISLMPQASYNPFVSQGLVSLSSDSDRQPINILRDTGALQSLLVEGVLPLPAETATGDHVMIHGVELDGVSLLLGNGIAGERIITTPWLSSLLCSDSVVCKILIIKIFHV